MDSAPETFIRLPGLGDYDKDWYNYRTIDGKTCKKLSRSERWIEMDIDLTVRRQASGPFIRLSLIINRRPLYEAASRVHWLERRSFHGPGDGVRQAKASVPKLLFFIIIIFIHIQGLRHFF